jgi:RND family efflux transporter MFP subunit
MKKLIALISILTLMSILFAVSCSRSKKEDRTGQETAAATPVKVAKVERKRISEKISYTGTIEAWKKINITPDVGGKIARIYVNEGDRVGQGQVLAELETEAIRLQLKQAEAGLAVAQASYNDALKNKERMDRLIKENAVSEQQYEKVKLGFDAAQAQLEQAQAAVNLAKHSLDVSIMKAPFSGIIASKNSEVGDVINPMMGSFSATSGVLTLMDFSRVKIKIDVSQNDVLRIRKGQTALVRMSSAGAKEISGVVSIVNSTADATTKKFGVEVVVDNPDEALRPGTFGQVTLEVSTHENALVVPQKAVMSDTHVFVALGDKAAKKEIAIGLQNTIGVEITSGLAEGDLVIVEGNFGLEDGAPIRINEGVKK